MREMEDRIERKLYRQGKVVGGVYVGRGQEAIPVGSALLLRARGHPASLPSRHGDVFSSAASPPRRIFAQYMGRIGGLTRGRDGNMHMGDIELNIVSIISALAATVPVAAGRRPGLRYHGQARRLPSATSAMAPPAAATGTKASTSPPSRSCPVVYICNNNQYAYSTPLHCRWPAPTWRIAAPPTACPPRSWTATTCSRSTRPPQRAVAHARAGLGPVPARVQDVPHDRPLRARRRPLRPQGAVRRVGEAGSHRAPREAHARRTAGPSRAELDAVRAGILAEVDEAVAWAERVPYPDPATLLDGVYEDQ